MTIDRIFINSFVKTTERGAYGASIFKGKNDKIAADQAAVDEMRTELNKINMKGKIVIGEGEMDEAPMLYINEEVGTRNGDEFDIAVDPLEGTNFTAKNLPNAISVIAVTKKGIPGLKGSENGVVIFKLLRGAFDAPHKGKVAIVGRNPEAIWFSGYEDRVLYDEAGLFTESMQSTSSVS